MSRAAFALSLALAPLACAASRAPAKPIAETTPTTTIAPSAAPASSSAAPALPAKDQAVALARGDRSPADADLLAGDRAYDGDDLTAAAAAFEAAAAKAPRDPAPIVGLVRVALAKAKVPTSAGAAPGSPIVARAIADLRRAVALDERFLPAWVDLGHALLVSGDADGAIGVLRKALALGPASAETHSTLGVALLASGAKAEAIKELARAVELEPREATRHTNLGKALISAGRLVDAMGELARVVELSPDDPRAASDLAALRLSAGDVDGALPLLARAIELDPKRASFHVNLAYARLLRGELDAAVSEAKIAIKLDETIASAWINLGIALARQKKLSEARAAFVKAQSLDPSDPRPQSNLDELGPEAPAKLPPKTKKKPLARAQVSWRKREEPLIRGRPGQSAPVSQVEKTERLTSPLHEGEPIMVRKLTLCLALALATVAAPAMAADKAPRQGTQQAAPSFPMPAAEFRDRIEKRLGKERARVETHITKKNLSPTDAEKARAVLNEKVARIDGLVAKVTSDGTVTKAEAREVHLAIHAAFPHHHKTAKK